MVRMDLQLPYCPISPILYLSSKPPWRGSKWQKRRARRELQLLRLLLLMLVLLLHYSCLSRLLRAFS